jgi:hypothetical protein
MNTISEKYHKKYEGCESFLGFGWRHSGDGPVAIRKNLLESIASKNLKAIRFYANALYFSGTGTNEEFEEIEKVENKILMQL